MTSIAAQCTCCELYQPAQYCPQCLQEGVATHQRLSRSLRAQCASSIVTSNQLLGEGTSRGLTAWRQIRADVARTERRIKRLRQRLKRVELDLADGDVSDPFTQQPVRSKLKTPIQLHGMVEDIQQRQRDIDHRLTHARKVLVPEAVNVFGVEHSSAGWSIAGLLLPQALCLKNHPSVFVNAAISHVCHLVTILTHYLSIALPFYPSYPTLLHVGRPRIVPNPPFLPTSKFLDDNPLWMSSTAWKSDAKSRVKHRGFLQAFGLLAQSVAYIAWTQGVDGIGIPGPDAPVQIPVTSLLRLLDATAQSPLLGVRAHEPGTGLLPHLGFGLDVAQVVAWTASMNGDEEDQTEEWDVVHRQDLHAS